MKNSERLYPAVERMVLWGEPTQSAYEMLAVNGVTGKEAHALVEQAVTERIRTIRSHFLPRLLKGLLLIVAGAALFATFWFYNGGITRGIFILCAGAAAWGAWRLIDGGVGWLAAPNRKGSVADL